MGWGEEGGVGVRWGEAGWVRLEHLHAFGGRIREMDIASGAECKHQLHYAVQ